MAFAVSLAQECDSSDLDAAAPFQSPVVSYEAFETVYSIPRFAPFHHKEMRIVLDS